MAIDGDKLECWHCGKQFVMGAVSWPYHRDALCVKEAKGGKA